MKTIGELFDLPARVHAGDFVLRLSEGVEDPTRTVDEYVVTEQLAKCFDKALGLVQSAVSGNSSKAAYLHGSFGSGKSHFMAILYLLLSGNSKARAIKELSNVVSKHNDWTEGKKFLLVPYHFLGAPNIESKILGGYGDYVAKHHPDAPTPAIYRSLTLLKDAENLRVRFGDEKFFEELGQRGGTGGWGDLEQGWDAQSFQDAIESSPRSEEHIRLVGDLIDTFFPNVKVSHEYIDLDEGLSVISQHAKKIGYDSLILFLDELILWLASRAGDSDFLAQEGQKLAKLVEAQNPNRPAPIVSFIARQKDIRELVGRGVPGAEKVSVGDTLNYMEGRFETITLEDRNLPLIAEKRVLKVKNDSCRKEIDEAFKELEKLRPEVLNVLLTENSDIATFRKTYPFSPALVDTLVAISSLVQRDRTALKIMLQMLIEQKNVVKLGEIIPAGDLFDIITEEVALTEEMKNHLENAKRLYVGKFLPMIEKKHKLKRSDVQKLSRDDAEARAFRADDRLIKTLLLTALVPEVGALKALDARRLAALNHGSIKSPIAGQEGAIVLGKVREWASQYGEIRISSDPTNPTISVQLAAVDTDSILAKAESVDNRGNRIQKIKELLFNELGFEFGDQLFHEHTFNWRGSRRSVGVKFDNVRTLPLESLRSSQSTWQLVIDFPFDDHGHSPKDDISKIEEFQQSNPEGSQTIVWLPSFFSVKAQEELGKLVKIDHVLNPNLFPEYVADLKPADRQVAKALLENQQHQLRNQLIIYLEAAYGIRNPQGNELDETYLLDPSEHGCSLDPSLRLQPAVGANLAKAMENILGQALTHQYPAHPHFEVDKITKGNLTNAFGEIEEAVRSEGGRHEVPKAKRSEVRQVVVPMKLADMGEMHLHLSEDWKTHFIKCQSKESALFTVANLRRWIDEPKPMGLLKEFSDLVILSFAAQTNKSFYYHGGPAPDVEIGRLDDSMELREEELPSEELWKLAVEMSAAIFGVVSSKLLNATNVRKLIDDIQKVIITHRKQCGDLVGHLQRLYKQFGVDSKSSRLATANEVHGLLERLITSDGSAFIERLATESSDSSAAAMGKSLKSAAQVGSTLCNEFVWEIINELTSRGGDQQDKAEALKAEVIQALSDDEYVTSLSQALEKICIEAKNLIRGYSDSKPTLETPAVNKKDGVKVISVCDGVEEELTIVQLEETLDVLRSKLSEDSGYRVKLTWEVYKT